MPQLADESHLEFFDRSRPQCTLGVLPEASQKCLVTSCIAYVDEVTPEGHLGRSEQHGLFDCPRGSVEVVDHHEISLELMSCRRDSLDHARDVLLIDGPFEESARFSVEWDTSHQLEGVSTKFNRLFSGGGGGSLRESAELSPVRTRVDQFIARPPVRFRQILRPNRLTRTRDVVEKRLLGNGGDLHRLRPQCVLNLVSRLRSIVMESQEGDDRTDGISCPLCRRLDLKRPEHVHPQFVGFDISLWLRRVKGSWAPNFCRLWRRIGSLRIRGRVEHRNVLHLSTCPSSHTPEDQTKENQRDNRKNLIQCVRRCRSQYRTHWTARDRCRQFARKRDSEPKGSINTKRGRRLALKTLELSSFGGGWTDRNGSGPGVARDKKPVGGVEETVVGCHVGVVRLADRIGFVCDVPSAGSTPEGDGGRCQGSHRGKEVTPIGLPVVDLYRAGARSEREVDLSFRCENSGSDDAGRREFGTRYVDVGGQGCVVGGIRDSKRKFLTELLNGGPLGCGCVRRRIQCRQHSYRQHHTRTTETDVRVPWK